MTNSQFQAGITGRYQAVTTEEARCEPKRIVAAGTVLWRRQETGELEIAVIHRPHYNDWSLPKGKVDEGESLPTTAAREAKEETGYTVRLGKLLGKVTYPVGNRTKFVYYWLAEVIDGAFSINSEVDELRWLSPDAAHDLLSYDMDQQVLSKAVKRLKTPSTARILLVRHAKAQKRDRWDSVDECRPLDRRGEDEARLLVPMLLPYRPTTIYSAQPLRCVQTAQPIASRLDLTININRSLGDEGWLESMKTSQAKIQEIIDAGGTSVIVSQGITIPDSIAWLSAKGTLPLTEIIAKKASVWVLSFTDGVLTGADYLESPEPLKY